MECQSVQLLVTRPSSGPASTARLRLAGLVLACCALPAAAVACAGSDPVRQPRQAESGTAGPASQNRPATDTPAATTDSRASSAGAQASPPGRSANPPASPPVRTTAPAAPPSAQPAPTPARPLVLLVHGYGGSPDELIPLARRLERAGYATVRVALPEHGLADMHASVAAVTAAVAAAGRTTALSAVGYSLGGLVLRLWLQQQGVGLQHLVMLSTPNAGVAVTAGPWTYPETTCLPNNACGQLQPGSALLGQLLPTPPHLGSAPVVLASSSDRLVHPASAFALPGATDILLQKVCADSQVGHGDFRDDSLVFGIVVSVLGGRTGQIAPGQCANLRALGR